MFEYPQRLRASILAAALLTFGCPGSSPDDAACGDGVVEGPEVCDDGNAITELTCAYGTQSCTACDSTCTRSLSLVGAYCGNGVLNAVEPCDDGNTTAGDGCTAACEIEAGYDCFEPTGCVVAPVLVRTTSGALAPLDGTVWTHCEANSPTTGQSRGRTEAFDWPEVTLTQDIYTASAGCTGPTDPAAHRVVRAVVISVTDRTVGWKGVPPAGLDAQVIASGLTFADPTTREVVLRDVRLLDADAKPLLVYAGNGDGPRDGDGFPAQLEPTPTTDQLFADLQGTWTSCIDEPAPSTDTFETLTISGEDVFSRWGPSTSTDGTCSGAYTPLESMLGTMSLGLGVQATLGSRSVTARAVDVSTLDGTFYSIIHLDKSTGPDLLYTGDEGATAGLDGSAPNKRPTVLESWKPRRKGNEPAPTMRVKTVSGDTFDLAGTTWTTCEAGYPQAEQSYWHAWTFGSGTATITHDVHLAATDCTGETDPGQHFSVTMGFQVGADRTVGWQEPAPLAYPASVVASGVTFSDAPSPKGVAFVDDLSSPPLIFITNPGDAPPPLDADGYPTVLPNFGSAKR